MKNKLLFNTFALRQFFIASATLTTFLPLVYSASVQAQTQWYRVIQCQNSEGKKLTLETYTTETGISKGARGRYENGSTVVSFEADKVSKSSETSRIVLARLFLRNGRVTFASDGATTFNNNYPFQTGDNLDQMSIIVEKGNGNSANVVAVHPETLRIYGQDKRFSSAASTTYFYADQCNLNNLDKIHY